MYCIGQLEYYTKPIFQLKLHTFLRISSNYWLPLHPKLNLWPSNYYRISKRGVISIVGGP